MFEDSPDSGCADFVVETDEFAVDTAIAPGRVVGRHLDDETADLGSGRWPPWFLDWLGPMLGDASTVPTQEGIGRDEPSVAARSGECLGYGAEQRPVVIGECWPLLSAAEDGELVAQDDDLDVFGAPGPYGEAGQRRKEPVQDAIHTSQDRSASALVNAHVRVSGTHTPLICGGPCCQAILTAWV
ncbi:MAG: hypothetical protein WBM50_02255 [Acidimicrobiales bacterium]